MGKKARAKRERRNSGGTQVEAPTVAAFLSRVGARPAQRDSDTFWEWLATRHGEAAERLEELVRSGSATPAEARWTAKNADLELSLDVSLGYSGEMYRSELSYLREIAQRLPEPARVLDVGCENGLVSSYLALLFPDAEVRGIDRNPAAISCAQELAARLRINNVVFEAVDLDDLGEEGADLILCSRVLTEAGLFVPDEQSFTIEEGTGLDAAHPLRRSARQLVDHLRDNGVAIMIERLPHAQAGWAFAKALADAGLTIDDAPGWIAGHETGSPESWPVFVARHRAGAVGVAQVLRAFAPPGVPLEIAAQENDAAAELLYLERGTSMTPVLRVELEYFEGGTERRELLADDSSLLLWRTTTRGFRRCTLHPRSAADRIDREIRAWGRLGAEHGVLTVVDFHLDAGRPLS